MRKIIFAGILLISAIGTAQETGKDKSTNLDEVVVKGYKTLNGIGHLLDEKDGIIYAGKKTEVILVDSLDANKAINNTRQILGRIPGLNIVETEGSGFTANGIATRGLNPSQSIEMNTRQNGYNISADVYGYNEAYYLPPMEAVKRIELVRGAAALQFGAQFGGLANYVLDDAPAKKPFEFKTSQTMGSFGMFNSFNSMGGNYKKISYYGYVQYRNMDGYRPNSQQWQLSAFGKIQYNASDKFKMGVEYSLLRNQLKMPGGLSDEQFNNDPKQSTRTRNWLKSPWNIITGYANFNPTENTKISLKTSYLFSNRSLVWRNEDGGPSAADTIDPATGAFVPREVEKEDMNNITTELRVSQSYYLGNQKSTMAAGIRHSYAWFKRLGGGEGTTNSDFDMSITGDWEYNFDFTTTNVAPFVENIFKISDKFTITPGVRFEYLKSTAKGYKIEDLDKLNTDQSRNRYFMLFGTGLEYKTNKTCSFYANISQAYRPMDYSQLQPIGVVSYVDPNLKDAKGYNSDLGYRGTVKSYLNFDVSAFYMAYNNRVGLVLRTNEATGEQYSVRTNVANSVHKGIESYVELNILKCINENSKYGLNIFNSFSYIDAQYTSGEFKGKRVEAAAQTINRIGLIFNSKKLSGTLQANFIGDAYGDASNVEKSDDPIAGCIPSYAVWDFSGNYKFDNFGVKFGVNNIADKAYFTRRTDEYPGPGIIPAVGRSFYIGFNARF
ncbi:TonB-dependent receptor domain-containing protein [uncultured Flavobacterium sp.]|uniref:TonB-dependent receptor family protein n=1 Tax=uncultured Flavobacterium sp. TaxID=165435 RepID=UPI00292CAA89|nr:TonB-dependent receptor [uncultured Flavobacterium sp.]